MSETEEPDLANIVTVFPGADPSATPFGQQQEPAGKVAEDEPEETAPKPEPKKDEPKKEEVGFLRYGYALAKKLGIEPAELETRRTELIHRIRAEKQLALDSLRKQLPKAMESLGARMGSEDPLGELKNVLHEFRGMVERALDSDGGTQSMDVWMMETSNSCPHSWEDKPTDPEVTSRFAQKLFFLDRLVVGHTVRSEHRVSDEQAGILQEIVETGYVANSAHATNIRETLKRSGSHQDRRKPKTSNGGNDNDRNGGGGDGDNIISIF